MSKGNPIVGLAYVVTSQQEMLEEANKKNDELIKERTNMLKDMEVLESMTFHCKRGDIPKHKVEATFRIYESRIDELIKQCNDIKAENDAHAEELKRTKAELQNAKDQEEYFSGEYNRVNETLLATQEKLLHYEQGRQFHWQKFQPDADGRMCLPLGHRHAYPIVDGLYHYTEEHRPQFYDEILKKSFPVKNCYGIGFVAGVITDGKFYISPNSEDGAELIGFSIRYIDDYIIMDEMPEELKEEVKLAIE